MNPRKFKIVIAGLHLLFKGSSKNISKANTVSSYHTITLQKRSWGILDFIFGFRGVIDPAETDFGYLRIDFLGEYDAKCETALGREPRVENLVSQSL
jgi:hypothetical protein